jgi:hypothetical protein
MAAPSDVSSPIYLVPATGANLRTFAGAGLSAIAIVYAARCLWLGLSLSHPMPLSDQWASVVDYFRYSDGTYRWVDLFAQHNEHRIVTTRVVLLADAILFQMRGLLPLGVIYASLAAIAALGASLATRAGFERFVGFALALGLLWSTSEWVDLSVTFNVQYAFVHLCAFVCLFATWRAGVTNPLRWTLLVCAADALAVFSLGSGLLVIGPVLLLALWLRTWRAAFVVAAFHAALIAVYFIGYQRPLGTPAYAFDPVNTLYVAATFVGLPFGRHEAWIGAGGLLLAAIMMIDISWRVARRRPVSPSCCVLAALAAFVILEAIVVGATRPIDTVGARYAISSTVFWAALTGTLWRLSEGYRSRPLVPAMATMAVVAMNAPQFAASWREQTTFLARATAEARLGTFDPKVMNRLCPVGDTEQAVRRLQDLRLGPFMP